MRNVNIFRGLVVATLESINSFALGFVVFISILLQTYSEFLFQLMSIDTGNYRRV